MWAGFLRTLWTCCPPYYVNRIGYAIIIFFDLCNLTGAFLYWALSAYL